MQCFHRADVPLYILDPVSWALQKVLGETRARFGDHHEQSQQEDGRTEDEERETGEGDSEEKGRGAGTGQESEGDGAEAGQDGEREEGEGEEREKFSCQVIANISVKIVVN